MKTKTIALTPRALSQDFSLPVQNRIQSSSASDLSRLPLRWPNASPILCKAPNPRLTGPGLINSSSGQVQRYLDAALKYGDRWVRAVQKTDGTFQEVFDGGPWHWACSLIALSHLGVRGLHEDHRDVVTNMMARQNADGSFPTNEGLPPSKASTHLIQVAMRRTLADAKRDEAWDPAFCERVRKAIERADHFLQHGVAPEDSAVVKGMSCLMTDIVGETDLLPNLPGTNVLMATWLKMQPTLSWVANHVPGIGFLARQLLASDPMRHFGPSMVLDVNSQAVQQSSVAAFVNAGFRLLGLGGLADRFLEREIHEMQDGEGCWVYSTVSTAVNAIALKEAGHDNDYPPLSRAIEFLKGTRVRNKEGTVVADTSFIGTVWDTAYFLDLMVTLARAAGTTLEPEKVNGALDALLGSQRPNGRWSFSFQGNLGDTDTTSVVLRTLSKLHGSLPDERQEKVRDAISRGVQQLLNLQKPDGGFGAFDGDAFAHFGSRAQTELETLRYDTSTNGLTGRVLLGLLAARQNTVLAPKLREEVDRSIARAVQYLQNTQREDGLWWTRWVLGRLNSANNVLPALRLSGMKPDQPLIRGAREFLLKTQNPDGGWGEGYDLDKVAAKADSAPSTPVQTAYALTGLIATADHDDSELMVALEKGVRYLESQQTEPSDGPHQTYSAPWDNPVNLYTIFPGSAYYEAEAMTTGWVLNAIAMVKDFVSEVSKGRTFRAAADLANQKRFLGEPSVDGAIETDIRGGKLSLSARHETTAAVSERA